MPPWNVIESGNQFFEAQRLRRSRCARNGARHARASRAPFQRPTNDSHFTTPTSRTTARTVINYTGNGFSCSPALSTLAAVFSATRAVRASSLACTLNAALSAATRRRRGSSLIPIGVHRSSPCDSRRAKLPRRISTLRGGIN